MSRRNQQPTYFNSTEPTAINHRIGSDGVKLPLSVQFATVEPELVVPVRPESTWKGKNVYEGDH